MEAFLYRTIPFAQETSTKDPVSYRTLLVELALVREMTGRLSSQKIEGYWNKIMAGVSWSGEEAAEKDIYIKSLKHKNSVNYSALYDY